MNAVRAWPQLARAVRPDRGGGAARLAHRPLVADLLHQRARLGRHRRRPLRLRRELGRALVRPHQLRRRRRLGGRGAGGAERGEAGDDAEPRPASSAITTVGNVPSLLIAAAVGGVFALFAGSPLMRLSGLAAGIATFAVLEITNNLLRYTDKVGPGPERLLLRPRDDRPAAGDGRRAARRRRRVPLPAQPLRAPAARGTRRPGGGPRGRDLRLPAAARVVRDLRVPRRLRGRPLRAPARRRAPTRCTSISPSSRSRCS